MSDFLSWDDDEINLDLLLGEYTEYDTEPNSDDENSKPSKKQKLTETQTQVQYMCPACQKILKTISGFRGHVKKQHNIDARASDNKVSPASESKTKVPVDNDFDKVFPIAYKKSLQNIAEDPFISSKEIISLCSIATSSNLIITRLQKAMHYVFVDSASNITSTGDREQLFRNLHRVRLDTSLNSDMCNLCPEFKPSVIHLFLQLFFEDIVGEMFREKIKMLKTRSEHQQSAVSCNDQSILFYIAGYIIKALKKRYSVLSCKNLSLIEKLVCHSDVSSFVTSYSKWFKKQNRGGLQKPSDQFFLLVRELENIVRSTVSENYSANSLFLAPLKESMMERFMVKHYVDQIFNSEECDTVARITEDIIHLFLTIRGHAVTRVQRNKIITNANTNRTSSSLRQVLKDKNVN